MHTLYNITLYLHSWNRWIILIAGLLTIIFAISGMVNKKDYTKRDRVTSLVFISSLHLQLLIGLLLYFVLSPITLQALSDFALVLILAMIPMGVMGVERPWFRF